MSEDERRNGVRSCIRIEGEIDSWRIGLGLDFGLRVGGLKKMRERRRVV